MPGLVDGLGREEGRVYNHHLQRMMHSWRGRSYELIGRDRNCNERLRASGYLTNRHDEQANMGYANACSSLVNESVHSSQTCQVREPRMWLIRPHVRMANGPRSAAA